MFLDRLGIQETVHVDDEIPNTCIVYRRHRHAPPGVIGRLIIRVKSHDLDLVEVGELCSAGIPQFAADYQMKQLLGYGRSPLARVRARVR